MADKVIEYKDLVSFRANQTEFTGQLPKVSTMALSAVQAYCADNGAFAGKINAAGQISTISSANALSEAADISRQIALNATTVADARTALTGSLSKMIDCYGILIPAWEEGGLMQVFPAISRIKTLKHLTFGGSLSVPVAYLIDCMKPMVFAEGRVFGCIHIPFQLYQAMAETAPLPNSIAGFPVMNRCIVVPMEVLIENSKIINSI